MKKPMKITVIDPDEIAFYIIKAWFDIAGYKADWLHIKTGREALVYLAADSTFDCLFLEPVMPDVSAATIFTCLPENLLPEESKVCLLSTISPGDLHSLGIGYSFLHIFRKPFRKEYLQRIFAKTVLQSFQSGNDILSKKDL